MNVPLIEWSGRVGFLVFGLNLAGVKTTSHARVTSSSMIPRSFWRPQRLQSLKRCTRIEDPQRSGYGDSDAAFASGLHCSDAVLLVAFL